MKKNSTQGPKFIHIDCEGRKKSYGGRNFEKICIGAHQEKNFPVLRFGCQFFRKFFYNLPWETFRGGTVLP